MLKVFQAQVLEFAFQLIQSELVGEWGIEIACLFAHFLLGFRCFRVTDLPHKIHPVGNHD